MFMKSLRDQVEPEMNPINVESGSDMSFLGLENIGIESAKPFWPTRPDRLPTLLLILRCAHRAHNLMKVYTY